MRDRVRAFQARMNFTDKELAQLWGIPFRTLRSYKTTDPNSPPLRVATQYADRSMFSLDWLVGREVPMWHAPAFAPYAEELCRRLEANPPQTYIYSERFGAALRSLRDINPTQFTPLFLSGLFELSQDVTKALLAGEVPRVPEETASFFEEHFGVNLIWMHTGTGPIHK